MSKKRNKLEGSFMEKYSDLSNNQYNYDYNLKGDFDIDFKHYRFKNIIAWIFFINGIILLASGIYLPIYLSDSIALIEKIMCVFILGGIGVLQLMASYNTFKKQDRFKKNR